MYLQYMSYIFHLKYILRKIQQSIFVYLQQFLYINDLYVEFHSHKDENAISENGENKETTFKLIEEIKQLGIKFTHWV